MGKRVFLVDIDLNKNQLLQARLENLATAPSSPAVGQMYYDTTLQKARYWNGSAWKDYPYVHPNHSGDVTSSGDGATTIVNNIVTNAKLAQMPANTIKGNNTASTANAIDLTIGQVIAMLADTDITLGGASTSDGKISSQKAVKTYVDTAVAAVNNLISGALVNKGGYDAATNTPDLDGTPIAGIKNGWTYVVTAAGNFFSEAVQIGDMVIAKQDSPTTLAHWTVVNKNIPDIVSASETAQGIIEIATQAETDTGTDDTRAVTPLKLASRIANVARKYSVAIGNGTLTSFTVTHSLNSQNVEVQVRNTATFEKVECEVIYATVNAVTLNFNVAPTTNQYTATVIG